MAISGLMVGLGNPGTRYSRTRHNFGFMFLDRLCEADAPEQACGRESAKGKALVRNMRWGGQEWLLVKPQTYMNLSGGPTGELSRFYKLSPEQVLIIHDELDLPLGRMQLRKGGGAAGHKGVASVAQHLGSKDFFRLRLGVGKPEVGEASDYVLRPFSADEEQAVDAMLTAAVEGISVWLSKGFEPARQLINSFRMEQAPNQAPDKGM